MLRSLFHTVVARSTALHYWPPRKVALRPRPPARRGPRRGGRGGQTAGRPRRGARAGGSRPSCERVRRSRSSASAWVCQRWPGPRTGRCSRASSRTAASPSGPRVLLSVSACFAQREAAQSYLKLWVLFYLFCLLLARWGGRAEATSNYVFCFTGPSSYINN